MHLDSLSREIDERSLVFFFKWNSRETRYLGSTTSLRQVMNVHWIFFQMEFDRNEVSRFHYFSTPNDERSLDFFFKWNSRETRYLGSITSLRQMMNVYWIFFQMEFERSEVSRFHYHFSLRHRYSVATPSVKWMGQNKEK